MVVLSTANTAARAGAQRAHAAAHAPGDLAASASSSPKPGVDAFGMPPNGGELRQRSQRAIGSVTDTDWVNIMNSSGLGHFQQQEGPSWREPAWVDNESFNIAIGGAIILNAMIMGVETDHSQDREYAPWLWIGLDNIFCSVWTFELVSRVYFDTWRYFTNATNILDSLLVALAIVEAWLIPLSALAGGNTNMDNLGVLKVARMLRMLRLLRLLRLMRIFKRLMKIVDGFIKAVGSLGWVLLLISLVIYSASVFLTIVIGHECQGDYAHWDQCKELYGTVYWSMYTLFQVITLESWSMVLARPVVYVKPWLIPFFVCFIFITTFGLLNIIVGVVVENTMEASNMEALQEADALELRKWDELKALRNVFEEADEDKSGYVDKPEFRKILARKDVKKRMEAIQLPHEYPDWLFDAIDEDDSGEISIEEFVTGAGRLKGAPSGQEMRNALLQINGIDRYVRKIGRSLGIADRSPSVERSPANVSGNVSVNCSESHSESQLSPEIPVAGSQRTKSKKETMGSQDSGQCRSSRSITRFSGVGVDATDPTSPLPSLRSRSASGNSGPRSAFGLLAEHAGDSVEKLLAVQPPRPLGDCSMPNTHAEWLDSSPREDYRRHRPPPISLPIAFLAARSGIADGKSDSRSSFAQWATRVEALERQHGQIRCMLDQVKARLPSKDLLQRLAWQPRPQLKSHSFSATRTHTGNGYRPLGDCETMDTEKVPALHETIVTQQRMLHKSLQLLTDLSAQKGAVAASQVSLPTPCLHRNLQDVDPDGFSC